MSTDDVAVIMPVYNEEQVVGSVVSGIRDKFAHVICINDGSSDGSSKAITKAGGLLIEHPINLGAGAATQTGIDYALQNSEIEYFITFDADGQHRVEDAVKMLKYLKKHKDIDIVFGSRFLQNSKTENMSILKGIFLKVAKIFSRFDTGVDLTDPHIGLRAFNRKFAENLKLTMSDFSHASELVRRVKESGYRYAELPVTVTYSDYSKSKGQPMLNAVNIAFDLLLQKVSKK